MTAIVAVKTARGVVMGADSAGIAEDFTLSVRRDPKVFWSGRLLIGFTDSFRMGQLVRFGIEPDAPPVGDLVPPRDPSDGLRFMVTEFVPKIREALKAGGSMCEESDGTDGSGQLLVAWDRQLFTVEGDLHVAELHDEYAAIGCAKDVCLGVLAARGEGTGEDRVRAALAIAEHHSGGVRGPYLVLSTEEQKLGGWSW